MELKSQANKCVEKVLESYVLLSARQAVHASCTSNNSEHEIGTIEKFAKVRTSDFTSGHRSYYLDFVQGAKNLDEETKVCLKNGARPLAVRHAGDQVGGAHPIQDDLCKLDVPPRAPCRYTRT
jgi:hypothetical protein